MAAQMTYHTPAARKNLQPGVDAVSALHGSRSDRLLPRVTWATGGKSKGGHFTPAAKPPKPRRPPRGASDDARTRYAQRVDEWAAAPVQPEIRVISRKDAPPGAYNVSLWHEMGHWQDFDPSTGNYVSRIAEGVTQGRQFAPDHLADEVTAMRRFLDAAYDTDAVHRVATRYGRQFGNYAASPHELWARAYSQWVAENVTDDALRDAGNSGVDYLRSITPGYQWERHEFATLGPLVEAVLRARGVRT